MSRILVSWAQLTTPATDAALFERAQVDLAGAEGLATAGLSSWREQTDAAGADLVLATSLVSRSHAEVAGADAALVSGGWDRARVDAAGAVDGAAVELVTAGTVAWADGAGATDALAVELAANRAAVDAAGGDAGATASAMVRAALDTAGSDVALVRFGFLATLPTPLAARGGRGVMTARGDRGIMTARGGLRLTARES